MRRHARGMLLVVGIVALVALLLSQAPALAGWSEERGDRAYLEERLSGLIGQTGLDPFDPVSPLVGTTILSLEREDSGIGLGRALVRFSYENGQSREYMVSLSHHRRFRGGWEYSSLGRLYAPHMELPGLLLGAADAPFHLGTPTPILSTNGLADAYSALNWGTAVGDVLSWSPLGDAVLATRISGPDAWLIPLDGSSVTRLAEHAADPQWTPDGAGIVFRAPGELVLSDRAGQRRWSLPAPGPTPIEFTAGRDGVLIVQGGALWRMPYGASDSSDLHRVVDLPLLTAEMIQRGFPLDLSPDGALLAYGCGPGICVTDLERGEHRRVDLGEPAGALQLQPQPTRVPLPDPSTSSKGAAAFWPMLRLAWSRDGQRLAVTQFNYSQQPRLLILDRSGNIALDLPIGPNDLLGTPQWTPDGRYIFLQAYPERGRRIIAIDVAQEQIFDLSQPGWDAIFSLSPDGHQVVLSNGRGGLWVASVERAT